MYDDFIKQLRVFAEEPDNLMPNLTDRAANVIEGLQEHEVEGGIALSCGHPVQALYAGDSGKGHCRWCEDLRK